MEVTTDADPPAAPGEPDAAGLSTVEARERLRAHGLNRLVPETRRRPFAAWALKALTDPMAVLLLIAGAVYLGLGDTGDAIATLVALVPITAVTLVLEARAERALDGLRTLAAPVARARRDGVLARIAAEELVPGDVIEIREGDVVPADARLLEGTQLATDESALTGESQPADKKVSDEDDGRAFAGTTVLSGRAVALVVATGAGTRYGEIGTLLATIHQPPTPLERLIRRLVGQLAIVAVAFCIGVAAIELARGGSLDTAIIAGVSLAIAAIPEEFPMVFALYLGIGAWRLARDRALVRRLAGVETLGATTVICADKTGTLTHGHLALERVVALGGASETDVLRAALMASEPDPFDPLETALQRAATERGLDAAGLHASPLVRDHPFDPERRIVTHVWREPDGLRVYAKGALEGVLRATDARGAERDRATAENASLAAAGMRVLGIAAGALASSDGTRAADEGALALLGLVAFSDPVRPGVAESLADCRAAGIRVILITGDHPATAAAVAGQLGFADGVVTGDELAATREEDLGALVGRATVFARILPEQKYRLVRALRGAGEIVAMTGDGTNDAPALREADIGVAMGERGTDVARAAATLVLLDDDFSTIVRAVRDGRRIFENLRRAFSYLIAFHAPLLLSALLIPLVGAPLLLLPIHLVWLELIVHPTASLIFEGDPASEDLMRRPPRRAGSLLDRAALARPVASGLTLTAAVLALYLGALGAGLAIETARAIGIVTLVSGQTVLVLAERSPDRPLWRTGSRGNRALLPVLLVSALSLVVAVGVAPVAEGLHLATLPGPLWATALAVAAIATLWPEPFKRPASATAR